MDNNFTRVCAVVCIILVQVSTAPTNNINDLNVVIKVACKPLFNETTPLPESCAKKSQEPLDPLCVVIVGYVIDLCKLKKIERISPDATDVCQMPLPTPISNLNETKAILDALKNKTACLNKCSHDMALCKRMFGLASLLPNKENLSANTQSNETSVKLESAVSTQSENHNPKPALTGKVAPLKEEKDLPSSSNVNDPTANDSKKNVNSKPPNQLIEINKSNVTSPVVNSNNMPHTKITDVGDENVNNNVAIVPKTNDGTNQVREPPIVPITSNDSKPNQKEEVVETQLSDQVVHPIIDAKKVNDELPDDQLNDQVQGDDEDPDAHDGNLQPEEPSEDGENNDDLSIREDDIKPSNLQPPQLKNEESNIPISENNGPFQESPDSHFFAYFLFFTCITIVAYIAFHNKNKILALALEGRRGRNGRRRPNTASYRKLDTSLEEAMMSNPSRGNVTHVIY